ncbi:hypothetical protein GN956_G18759 [Arapaima gigas]
MPFQFLFPPRLFVASPYICGSSTLCGLLEGSAAQKDVFLDSTGPSTKQRKKESEVVVRNLEATAPLEYCQAR